MTILDEDGGEVARVATNEPLGKGEQSVRWDGHDRRGDPRAGGRVPRSRRPARRGPREHPAAHDQARPDAAAAAHQGGRRSGRAAARDRRSAARDRPGPGAATGQEAALLRVADGRREAARRRRAAAERGQAARTVERTDRRPARAAGHVHDHRGGARSRGQSRLGAAHAAAAGHGQGCRRRGRAGAPGRDRPAAQPGRVGNADGVGVDAGGRRYSWSLRRVDGERVARGRVARRAAVAADPGRAGGRARPDGADARRDGPGRRPGLALRAPRPVLVVLPALTWQGRNDVDDYGDGLPDSLARERKARVQRPFAGGRLPIGFKSGEANLLAYLDRNQLRYELTTDLALARAGGAPLEDHEARDPRRRRALAARSSSATGCASSSAAAGGSSPSASTRSTGRWRSARAR